MNYDNPLDEAREMIQARNDLLDKKDQQIRELEEQVASLRDALSRRDREEAQRVLHMAQIMVE